MECPKCRADREAARITVHRCADWSAEAYGKGAVMQEVPKFVSDALDEAERLGREHGHAAATWVLDGNSTEADARYVLSEDFEAPAPLSGEWADGMTLGRLYSECGIEDSDAWIPDDLDAIATVYEEAYYRAWYEEADRMATAVLSESGSATVYALAIMLLVVIPVAVFLTRAFGELAEVMAP